MSSHIIIPPKKPPPTLADKVENERIEGELTRDDGSPVTERGTKRIKVPKGTTVTIGGREYVAQSDDGIEVRGFTHANGGQQTSVVIINAPTKEAAAFAAELVACGQMLSEDEVLWRRARGLLIDPALTYDRRTGKLLSYAHTKQAIAEAKAKLLAARAVEVSEEASEAPRAVTTKEAEEAVELSTRGKVK